MKVIPRLILGMEFSSTDDRAAWAAKLQTAWSTLKLSMPIPTKVVITQDEYITSEREADINLG